MVDLSCLPDTIVSETNAIERFVRLLEQENVFLTEGQIEQLPAIVEEKERVAAQLNELTQQRGHLLDALGFSHDRKGMEAWSAQYPEQKDAIAAWNRTLSLAVQAREQNHINAQLIQLYMTPSG